MSRNSNSVRTTRRRLRVADDPSRLHEALGRLASILDEAAEEQGWGSPPSLVAIMSWPDDADRRDDFAFDFGIKPLDDGMGVIEALAGFDAPPEWAAIGVVTEGNARHMVDPTVERRRVRCVHLVDRTGASGSVVRLQGDEPLPLGDGSQPEGRIDDSCRRALGLATAPPASTTLQLWAVVWLERVIEWVGCCGPDVDWVDLATLHPAVAVLVGDDEARWERDAADKLVRLGEVLADVQSWPVLRLACAAGEWAVDDVPADVAGWLDDGAFSRWVLGAYPSLDQLLAAACEVVQPSIRRRLRGAVHSWSLLP
jgi:hypothetical protein